MPNSTWTSDRLDQLNERFEHQSPREVLRWSFETFGTDVVMGTGFGYSGVALMHLVSTVQPGATVFYLDTDLLFPETYTLRDQLAERLDLTIVRVHSGITLEDQTAMYGPDLWERDPDQCCFMRKVRPLRRYLSDRQAWITAIRRDQSVTRADTDTFEWNAANQVLKLNPLASWTAEDVWGYINMYDLPYNPLHDDGYPSIGCMPCTKPVTSDDDERAGRWNGTTKTECGIHLNVQATYG